MKPFNAALVNCPACNFFVAESAAATSSHASFAEFDDLPVACGAVLRERYKLLRPLGRGAHGATFLAEHLFLSFPCVVKLLPRRIGAGDHAVSRLKTEALAGLRVNHPNVVRVLDCDVHDSIGYLVTEFADGVDLASLIRAGALLDWRQAARLALEAANGLVAIHSAGLVHGDVKPGNMILGIDGRLRLADFGVATLSSDPNGLRIMNGTIPYAAPEMSLSEADVDARSDLYSLGVSLFELLTGRVPHDGSSVYRALLDAHNRPATWPSNAPMTPNWLVETVLRLLDSEPAGRFSNAEALVEHLEGAERRVEPRRPQPEWPAPRGVCVLAFRNENYNEADEWIGQAIADRMARGLARMPNVVVVDRDELARVLSRSAVGDSTPDHRRMLAAGRLIGAAAIIGGGFARNENELRVRITANLAGRDREAEIGTVSGKLSGLADLEEQIFRQVSQALGIETRPSTPARPALNLIAQRHFFAARKSYLRGDYEAAIKEGREALTLEPRYGDVIGLLGVCFARLGRYDDANAHHLQLEAVAAETGDDRLRVEAAANLGSMHYYRGEYDQAKDHFLKAARDAERIGLTNETALIYNNLGFALMRLGSLREAEDAFSRSIESHKAYGGLTALIGPYSGMGNVLREQQRYDAARDYYRRALTLADESDDRVNVGICYMNLGHCASLQGQLNEAKRELALALTILEQTRFWNGLARVYESIAELNVRLGNFTEALRCTDRRLELARLHQNKPMETAAWRQRAEVLASAGENAAAEECLARSAAIQAASGSA